MKDAQDTLGPHGSLGLGCRWTRHQTQVFQESLTARLAVSDWNHKASTDGLHNNHSIAPTSPGTGCNILCDKDCALQCKAVSCDEAATDGLRNNHSIHATSGTAQHV